MIILVAGGSGFIGRKLVDSLLEAGHSVTLLTRDSSRSRMTRSGLHTKEWDAASVGRWGEVVDRADAIINLTGELIAGKRWTKRQKVEILGSRLRSTRALVKAIEQASKKPSILINASAVGYYGSVASEEVSESSPPGHDFLAEVCRRWEEEASLAANFGVRVIMPRFGVVLADDGGALTRMALPFKLFAGGHLGTGKQWFPWIHRDDVVAGLLFVLQSPAIEGAVNFVAPETLTMKEFSRQVGETLHRPSWAPVPALALRLVLGEMAEMLLTGQRVIPKKLLDGGYIFRHPTVISALQEALVSRQGKS